jgi:outer membrane biosynthesis protein TonB
VVEAPPAGDGRVVDDEAVRSYTDAPSVEDLYTARPDPPAAPAVEAAPAATPKKKKKAPAKSATAPKPKKKKATASTTTAAKAAAKKSGTHRKGSVDRKGEDFDSPRARAVEAWLTDNRRPIVSAEAALDNKKTLARVVWAVGAADAAGSEHGLTAADASALLSSAAGLDVFATNVARAFRDESDLFVETVPDGRSKRYKLTAAGRARLGEVETR